MELKNKNVLIISQQDWGTMFISKHHYAIALANQGNNVYYMNGPDQESRLKVGQVEVKATEYKNVYIVNHRLFFPYLFKFKARPIYDFLLGYHLNKVLKKIDREIDIVWSFDISNTIPLWHFTDVKKRVYMPVDEFQRSNAGQIAKGADVIFSVTNEILEKFEEVDVPKVFLNHGVADFFINIAPNVKQNNPIQIGLSGNFLRSDIDRGTLLDIIIKHPEYIFNFWGSVDYSESNIASGKDSDATAFIEALKKISNVILHGQLPPLQLADKLKQVDCFLICYDIQKDHSKGTNYHKVMEYLATGKVVVSNNITTYQKHKGLIEMPEERNNDSLNDVFTSVINNLITFNSLDSQKRRIQFASLYTYANQLKKIEEYLN